MKKEGILNTKSLKEQVYEYLRDQMRQQKLEPGSAINMDATSKKLGISKTPLRDALIQLEMEGFVSIMPRKGIYVNGLSIQDVKEYYQVIGALESSALSVSFDKIGKSHTDKMRKLITEMKAAIAKNNFNLFNKKNLAFHNIYIDLSGNQTLKQTVNTLKKRLYDFPSHTKWIKEWEESSIKEHMQLIEAIEQGDVEAARAMIHDVHWSFEIQEKFIRKYYFNETD
jgi:DNA-binding GntR family transcriptional regulator